MFAADLFVVGDDMPSWIEQFTGADAGSMIEQDLFAILRGNSVSEIADELQRRWDDFGVSYVIVRFMEQFAPLVERLTGH